MRLAIIYDAVYPYVRGGAERRYHELASRLARSGHEVHWYGMHYWDGPRVWHHHGITYHGVCRPRELYTSRGRRSILQAIVFGVASLRLAAARYDVVDCCGFPYFSTFAARLATAVRGGTLVSTWHEFWGADYWRSYLGPLGVVGQLVERAAARMPCRIIAVSSATASGVSGSHGAASVTVLPNGVDSRALRAARPDARSCDVIYVGRLCDYKDVELLLASVSLLVEQDRSLTCRIVGDGPHRSVLETLSEDLGLTDRVEFTGSFPCSDDVYSALAAARVLVVPSRREGFGIVVVEANALGVPAVVVAHPNNSAVDHVVGDNGLVSAPEPARLAAAIDEVLQGRPGQRAAACRAYAAQFDWDEIADEYERVLSEAAS